MATHRDTEVALALFRRAGYSTGRVRPEHLRLADSDRATDGTVADWIRTLPAPKLDTLLDRLACRGTEDPGILDAERLLAALNVLLPGETLVTEAAARPIHSPTYAVHLETLAADLAARTLGFLQSRHDSGLAPVKLLDSGYRAVRMLDDYTVPDVQRDPFVQPAVKAIRAAVMWMVVRYGPDTTGDRLRDALKAADW